MEKNYNSGIIGGLCAAFYTLGCRVNQYETQAIEEQFRQSGFKIMPFESACDVYVINTCTVTAESDRKSRQIIRRTAKIKKPTSVVIVCGCYSQGKPDPVAQIPGVDLVLGNSRKTEICALALDVLKNKRSKTSILVKDISKEFEYERSFISSSDRTRAFVKIADGCENHCTYCIIPSVRGKIRSRSKEDILAEIKTLVANGYREFVLTGIETAAYGKDFKDKTVSPLSSLIAEVAEIDGVERIRLGSMEPTVFTESFVKTISSVKKLMPHFHLSLQSGSDSVLRLMKRKYNTEQFYAVCERLRRYIPDVHLTTDIIVGFPGETEESFRETVEFSKKCRFSHIHIFPYSKREGTPAASMKNQIDKKTKKQRVAELERENESIRFSILNSICGTKSKVLLEMKTAGFIDGYLPCYIKVIIPINETENINSGEIRNVEITGITKDTDGTVCALGRFI